MTRPSEAALRQVAAAVDRLRDRSFALVGGRGGAGKSTLTRALPDVAIVGTDEFWDGARFDLGRLERETIDPLRRGEEARFESYDWTRRERRGPRTIEPRGIVVVEGVCALHRRLRDAYALRIWVETPRDVCLERGIHRDGEAARPTWETVWMPGEDDYIARDDPIACADLVVAGL